MKVLGIVPARQSSQRFPNKHHTLLLGKPMFAYTLEAALAARHLDRVVISSDDRALRPLAKHYGIEFLERPEALATPTAALEDTLRHVTRQLQVRDRFEPDVVVNMFGNVPVRKPGQVDEVIEQLNSLPEATAVCTAEQVRLRPEWAKVLKAPDTLEVKPYLQGHTAYRFQDYPPLFMQDGAVAAVRTSVLLRQEVDKKPYAWLGEHIHLLIQEHTMYSLEVDYPDQRALAEFYLTCQQVGEDWIRNCMTSKNAKPTVARGVPS